MGRAVRVAPVYQLKISLLDTRPPVWRRLLLSANLTLRALHEIIQTAMGWTGRHPHQFIIGETVYGDPLRELARGGVEDERGARLDVVAPRVKHSFLYDYDLGEGWRHLVVVEKIRPRGDTFPGHPVCLAGARACPPEDWGGPSGYVSALAAIRNPQHEEHEEMLEWVGGSFAPEAFNVRAINKRLKRIA